MVERVVDSVLESLPDPLRILCDRSGILVALEGMGAISLLFSYMTPPDVVAPLQQDEANVPIGSLTVEPRSSSRGARYATPGFKAHHV